MPDPDSMYLFSKQLREAGIIVVETKKIVKEVIHGELNEYEEVSIHGELYGWKFTSSGKYSYTEATISGAGLNQEDAEFLNKKWKKKIRVNCWSGGIDVASQLKRKLPSDIPKEDLALFRTIRRYHIDNTQALIAFANFLRYLNS